MATITNFLSSIDLDSLITIFDIQIALALVIIALLIKGVVARIIIRIVYSLTKNPKKAKEELNWGAEKNLEDMCRDSWNYIMKK